MCFSGLDPTGGAGIQADIETVASMGCHCAPVITALTAQDTRDVKSLRPVDPGYLREQAGTVLADMPVAAFKIGLLGSLEVARAVADILEQHQDVPVILDPILRAGGGTSLAEDALIDFMRETLLPRVNVLTPNGPEARRLFPAADGLDACGKALLDAGCEFVLITGTHDNTEEVINTLYGDGRRMEAFSWPRLPVSYHGSGCTLAAAIAGLLAVERDLFNAIHEAQEYTWAALQAGYRVGRGQWLPNRLFWGEELDEQE